MHSPKLWTLLILLLSLGPTLANADDYEFLGNYREHRLDGSLLTVETANRPLKLHFYTGGVIEVVVGESQAVPLDPMARLEQTISLTEKPDLLIAETVDGRVEISKSPVRLTFRRSDGTIALADDPKFGHGWSGNEVRTWKVLPEGQRFFGLGEKSGPVEKSGRFWTNWNADTPAYRDDSDPLYCGIPFFWGMNKGQAFGIFFANSYRSTYNLGAGNRRLFSFGADSGAMRYYVFLGPTGKDVLASYSELSGRMPLPPQWALGYQQCRWSYYPEYEIRDVAKEFRQRKIPADVLYFDIHHMDSYKVFSWDPKWFPEPAKLLADLKNDGFKTVTIVDPGVKIEAGYDMYEEGLKNDGFLRYLDGELFEGQVWPGWCHFPDFRQTGTRAWWGSKNAKNRTLGVDGFWNDMNEPALWGREMPFVVEGIKSLHNVYGLLMAQATYQGLLDNDAKLRPFIVTRAGWSGIQRYAAVWTGDNSASYDDLALSIRTNLGLGLSGVPFVGCDIGGFIGSPDSELYTRWMQAATLSPFMRSHTVQDSPDQEPWSFGEETERRCREAIERRYALLPYLYSELHTAHKTGLPILRPLWLEWPNDPTAYLGDYQHQFMVGRDILAAPVIKAGQRFQKVYLPAGTWYEVESSTIHQGGRTVLIEAGLDSSPLFYRAGAMIPTRTPEQYVGEHPLDRLDITVVPGAAGSYTVTLDDGLSTDGAQDNIVLTFDGKRKLDVKFPEGPYSRSIRTLRFRLAGHPHSEGARYNGKVVAVKDGWMVASAGSGQLLFPNNEAGLNAH